METDHDQACLTASEFSKLREAVRKETEGREDIEFTQDPDEPHFGACRKLTPGGRIACFGRQMGRVEMWRGAVGRAYLWPPLSSGGASRARPWSVSTSRSSNRTCGFPASGSRTRATLSPTESCAFGPPGGPVPTSRRDIRRGTSSRPGGSVLAVSGATTDAADTACVDPPRGRLSLRVPDRSSWTNPPASDSEREPWPWHPTGAGSAQYLG